MGERQSDNPGEGRRPEGQELESLFSLCQIIGMPGPLEALAAAEQNPLELILRHVTRDWGELADEDKEENDRSVKEGCRILSSYKLKTGAKVWLITEWDRSVTTILRPEDY